MGPNSIGGVSSAALATSFSAAKEIQTTATTGNLKINYGDAAKAERLASSLEKIQQMQTQAQAFVKSKNPGFAGVD